MAIVNSLMSTNRRIFQNKPFIKGMSYTNADLYEGCCRSVTNLDFESNGTATKVRQGLSFSASDSKIIKIPFYNYTISFDNYITPDEFRYRNADGNGSVYVQSPDQFHLNAFQYVLTSESALSYVDKTLTLTNGKYLMSLYNEEDGVVTFQNQKCAPMLDDNRNFNYVIDHANRAVCFMGRIGNNYGIIRLTIHSTSKQYILEFVNPIGLDNVEYLSHPGLNVALKNPMLFKEYLYLDSSHDYYKDYAISTEDNNILFDNLISYIYNRPVVYDLNNNITSASAEASVVNGIDKADPDLDSIYVKSYLVLPPSDDVTSYYLSLHYTDNEGKERYAVPGLFFADRGSATKLSKTESVTFTNFELKDMCKEGLMFDIPVLKSSTDCKLVSMTLDPTVSLSHTSHNCIYTSTDFENFDVSCYKTTLTALSINIQNSGPIALYQSNSTYTSITTNTSCTLNYTFDVTVPYILDDEHHLLKFYGDNEQYIAYDYGYSFTANNIVVNTNKVFVYANIEIGVCIVSLHVDHYTSICKKPLIAKALMLAKREGAFNVDASGQYTTARRFVSVTIKIFEGIYDPLNIDAPVAVEVFDSESEFNTQNAFCNMCTLEPISRSVTTFSNEYAVQYFYDTKQNMFKFKVDVTDLIKYHIKNNYSPIDIYYPHVLYNSGTYKFEIHNTMSVIFASDDLSTAVIGGRITSTSGSPSASISYRYEGYPITNSTFLNIDNDVASGRSTATNICISPNQLASIAGNDVRFKVDLIKASIQGNYIVYTDNDVVTTVLAPLKLYTKDIKQYDEVYDAYGIVNADKLVIHQGHCVRYHNTKLNALYYSAYSDPTYFPSNYVIQDFKDPIVHVHSHQNSLIVFTTSDIYMVYNGTVPSVDPNDMESTDSPYKVKCIQSNISLGENHCNTVRSIGKDVFFIDSSNTGWLLKSNKYVENESDVYMVKLTSAISDLLRNPYEYAKNRLIDYNSITADYNYRSNAKVITTDFVGLYEQETSGSDLGISSGAIDIKEATINVINSNTLDITIGDVTRKVVLADITSVSSTSDSVISNYTTEFIAEYLSKAQAGTKSVYLELAKMNTTLDDESNYIKDPYTNGYIGCIHVFDSFVHYDSLNGVLIYNGLAKLSDSISRFTKTAYLRSLINASRIVYNGRYGYYNGNGFIQDVSQNTNIFVHNKFNKIYVHSTSNCIYIFQMVMLDKYKALTIIYKYSIEDRTWSTYDINSIIQPYAFASDNSLLGFKMFSMSNWRIIPETYSHTVEFISAKHDVFATSTGTETQSINVQFDTGNQSLSTMHEKRFKFVYLLLGNDLDFKALFDQEDIEYEDFDMNDEDSLIGDTSDVDIENVTDYNSNEEYNIKCEFYTDNVRQVVSKTVQRVKEGVNANLKIRTFCKGRIPRFIMTCNVHDCDFNLLQYGILFTQKGTK